MRENPKHYAGRKKIPFGDIPAIVLAELGVAMHEGARKYGAFNYRKDAIIASDYYSAAMRHLFQWYELGEDIDPESGISHVTKAIACLTVLRDAQINNMVKDDRPPPVHGDRWYALQGKVAELQALYCTQAPRVTSWDDTKTVLTRSEYDRAVDAKDVPDTLAAVEMGEYYGTQPVAGSKS